MIQSIIDCFNGQNDDPFNFDMDEDNFDGDSVIGKLNAKMRDDDYLAGTPLRVVLEKVEYCLQVALMMQIRAGIVNIEAYQGTDTQKLHDAVINLLDHLSEVKTGEHKQILIATFEAEAPVPSLIEKISCINVFFRDHSRLGRLANEFKMAVQLHVDMELAILNEVPAYDPDVPNVAGVKLKKQ